MGMLNRVIASAFISITLAAFIAKEMAIGIDGMAYMAIAELPMLLFVSLLYSGVKKAYLQRMGIDGTARCIRAALYYSPKGMPLPKAVEESSQLDGNAEKFIKRLSRLMLLGAGSGIAVHVAEALGAEVYSGGSARSMLAYAVEKEQMDAERKAAGLRAGLQRNATISMFVSSILPAFAVFIFIGNAALSGRPMPGIFAVVMLGAMPMLYALGSASVNRRFIG